jgi:hypothetical protein
MPVASSAPAPEGYPMCGGQHLALTTPPQRSGAVSVQLAPAFLDEMSACRAADSLPKDVLARAGEGKINDKGDCVFESVGVSCHYHSGTEFITASTKEEPVGQGEVHCIVPSDDPKSPRVFGAHITCSDPNLGKPAAEGAGHGEHGGHAEHAPKTGASCSSAILTQLSTCQASKCCDDGTLTNAITDLVKDGRNDVRPDFRICEQSLTIDCSLLDNMHPHTANAPGIGGVQKPSFSITPPPSKPGAKEAKSHADSKTQAVPGKAPKP